MIDTKTTVLLPAHNEEKAIGLVIKDIRSAIDCDIVVSASGCTDNTISIARKSGADVIISPKGKGLAVSNALKQITSDRVIMLDSDLTYPARYIPIMVDMLQYNDAVVGIRGLNKVNNPGFNRFGNEILSHMAQILYSINIHDVCSGMWAFNSNVVKTMDIKSSGFTLEAEILAHLYFNHYKLGQITIDYNNRIGPTKLNKVKDGFKIMSYLVTRRINGKWK